MFRDNHFTGNYSRPSYARGATQKHRFTFLQRYLKTSLIGTFLLFIVLGGGVYEVARRVVSHQTASEHNRLREENLRNRQQLIDLKNRLEAVEDRSRRLAQMSGAEGQAVIVEARGAGGPVEEMDADAIALVEARAIELDRNLSQLEIFVREQTRIPSIIPTTGDYTDGFGGRRDPFGGATSELHSGQDISAPTGTPVVAAGGGTVTFAGTQNGYGNIVIITHGEGLTTRYAHLSEIKIEVGAQVERGQLIGLVGSTGRSTAAHLHYEVRLNEEAMNPRRYLPENGN